MSSKLCAVHSCIRESTRRGWCQAHYRRWQKTGDLQAETPLARWKAESDTCLATGCDRPHAARGMCASHSRRAKSGDNSEAPIRGRKQAGMSVLDVFLLFVEGDDPPSDDSPWLWTGNSRAGTVKGQGGYGSFRFKRKKMLAHRVSYELFVGPIPEGLVVRHRNDTPLDVNPRNLILGTQRQNMQDKIDRSRQARGVNLPQHKLTELDVVSIRDAWPGISQRELARRYGVCGPTVSNVVNRRTWKHVP